MPPPRRESAVPAPTSRGKQVLQLGELDLPLPFSRACSPRENVEDQLRAIDDFSIDPLFNLTKLRRSQLVVENDDVGGEPGAFGCQVFEFSAADERRGIGGGPLLNHLQNDVGACRIGEAGKLLERLLGIVPF